MDETRWKVFAEKAGKTGHLWWLWLFAGEDSVVYVLDPSRSHNVPQSHFGDGVQGVLMVDRYIAYKIMRQVKEGKLALAFCWPSVGLMCAATLCVLVRVRNLLLGPWCGSIEFVTCIASIENGCNILSVRASSHC